MPKTSPASTPVVRTARLARLLPFYRDVLGLRLVQHIPGVAASFAIGDAELQLWQRNDCEDRSFCVVTLGPEVDVARLHARVARTAPAALLETRPTLQDWGSWEFGLVDPDGHQLVFEQWVPGLPSYAGPEAAQQRRGLD